MRHRVPPVGLARFDPVEHFLGRVRVEIDVEAVDVVDAITAVVAVAADRDALVRRDSSTA